MGLHLAEVASTLPNAGRKDTLPDMKTLFAGILACGASAHSSQAEPLYTQLGTDKPI